MLLIKNLSGCHSLKLAQLEVGAWSHDFVQMVGRNWGKMLIFAEF